MIGKITGNLIEKIPPQILIDVGGIAYEVDVSMQTFYALPELNNTVSLVTQLIIREDAHLLFGFATKEERTTFRQLIKVTGIGAKTALGILSALSTDELAHAVANDDVKWLSTVPGIGKKTAERLIVELRGKLQIQTQTIESIEASGPLFSTARSDIVGALIALGYHEKDAIKAVKALPEQIEVGEGVRLALKNMISK